MLSNVLEPYLDGRLGGALIEDTERLPVRVRAAKHDRQDLARIRALGIPTGNDRPEAGWTPLDSLGRFELQPEQSTIRHQDGKRTISVEAFVYPGVLPSEVLEPFLEQNSAQLEALPPGYSYEVGGDSGERNEAIGRLLAPAAVLFTLLIAVLVLTFSSFRLAGLIVVVAVASAGLAMLALWLTGMPFGFMAIVGTMGLLGVAVNDGIVVLTGVRESSPSGDPVKVRKAVVHSTRHVLTTTMTTAVGFLPLIIDGGRFWPPLATAIGFGIVGATILALVFVPATYLLLTPLAGRNSEGGISPE
jgi:multidrug efflux pump subunit AcrB